MKDSSRLNGQVREWDEPVHILNVAFDVGLDKLNWYAEPGGRPAAGDLANTTPAIEATLDVLGGLAERHGCGELRVICESTGVYHRSLLVLAARCGMRTALVSGEAVAKLRVVEGNDPGKTDVKDPRAIHTAALVGRLLVHRRLDEQYECLRAAHRLVCAADDKLTAAKTEMHHALKALLPDLKLSKDVLFGRTGRALIAEYGADPHVIAAAGRDGFERAMRSRVRGVQRRTLDSIWSQAAATLRQDRPRSVAAFQSQRVRQLAEEIDLHERRKRESAEQMKQIYRHLRELDPRLPAPQKGVLSELGAARLIAETGPMSDFRHVRQITRYAGLSLRERQSGRWRGQTRLSRRGRAALRRVLNQLALPLVRRGHLYGEYYHRKKEVDKMPGTKAMVCVMRKLLKMLFGWYQSASAFDARRVFQCLSAYRARAA